MLKRRPGLPESIHLQSQQKELAELLDSVLIGQIQCPKCGTKENVGFSKYNMVSRTSRKVQNRLLFDYEAAAECDRCGAAYRIDVVHEIDLADYGQYLTVKGAELTDVNLYGRGRQAAGDGDN